MAYIFSTLTCDNEYTLWKRIGEDRVIPVKSVIIKGGTGIVNKNLITPMGVMTEVTDEQLELLEQNPSFKRHKENGFLVVEKTKQEPEKVASKMKIKDKSAPKVEADFDLNVSK